MPPSPPPPPPPPPPPLPDVQPLYLPSLISYSEPLPAPWRPYSFRRRLWLMDSVLFDRMRGRFQLLSGWDPLAPPPSPPQRPWGERAVWGSLAILLWFSGWEILTWANPKHCSICRLRQSCYLCFIIVFLVAAVMFVGLTVFLAFKFREQGCTVSGRSALLFQITVVFLSTYISTALKDLLSALVALLGSLSVLSMCNLVFVMDRFGIVEGALSIINYVIIYGIGNSVVRWCTVATAATALLFFKYAEARRGERLGDVEKGERRITMNVLEELKGKMDDEDEDELITEEDTEDEIDEKNSANSND